MNKKILAMLLLSAAIVAPRVNADGESMLDALKEIGGGFKDLGSAFCGSAKGAGAYAKGSVANFWNGNLGEDGGLFNTENSKWIGLKGPAYAGKAFFGLSNFAMGNKKHNIPLTAAIAVSADIIVRHGVKEGEWNKIVKVAYALMTPWKAESMQIIKANKALAAEISAVYGEVIHQVVRGGWACVNLMRNWLSKNNSE